MADRKPPVGRQWWHNPIRVGEKLGARIQLARTYFYVGRRLLAFDRVVLPAYGIRAQSCLEKAGQLFEVTVLDKDAAHLRKVRGEVTPICSANHPRLFR